MKGKGLVYRYDKTDGKLESISTRVEGQTQSSPVTLQQPENTTDLSEHSSSHSLHTGGSTGFSLGSSSKNLVTGTTSGQRKPRNRPPAWKRRIRRNVGNPTNPIQNGDKFEGNAEGSSKRKAENPSEEVSKKQNQNQENPVASILKPLPNQ